MCRRGLTERQKLQCLDATVMSCLCEAGFEDDSDGDDTYDSDIADTYDSDIAAPVPGGCE